MKKLYSLALLLCAAVTAAYAQSTWNPTLTGTAATQWTASANWTPSGVPSPTTDVIIPAGKSSYPAITSATASCRTLTIQSNTAGSGSVTVGPGATLAVNVATGTSATAVNNAGTLTLNGTLRVKANIVNNGTINSGDAALLRIENTSGTVNISGTGTTILNDVTFGAGAASFASTLASQARITRRALLAGGNVTTNGKLRFAAPASNPAGTSGYVYYGGSGRLNGPITVERPISPLYNQGNGYRHYSTPVADPAFSSLATSGFSPIINTSYAYPTNNALTPYPNVFYFDEAAVVNNNADAFEYGWRCPAGSTLETTRGYTVNINSSAMVALTGTPNEGTLQTAPLGRGAYAQSGFHLVGNPYATPIDVFQVMTDNLYDDDPAHVDTYNPDGFDGTVYFYRSLTQYSGRYQAINVTGAGSSDSLTQLFPVMQGFFVRKTTSANAKEYTFNDSQRADPLDPAYSTTALTPFFRSAAGTAPAATATPTGLFRLQATDLSSGAADQTNVGFRPDATAGHDPRYDALRPADNRNVPTLLTANAAGQACMVNFLPALTTATRTVPVGLRTLVPGRSYALNAGAVAARQALPAGTRVWLEDREQGQSYELTAGATLTFTAAAVAYEHRFFLRFESGAKPLGTQAAAAQPLQLDVYPNPAAGGTAFQVSAAQLSGAQATLTLLNALGQTVTTKQLSVRGGLLSGEVTTAGLPAGVYLLRLTTAGGTSTQRLQIR
ncbi:T9SS type A sorting domain-containing protein [Hymenobacter jeollabukensis]|uniref:T9SS type A sorting domain-containing protein n=1 Tax=Hymenobacter jeollabukensis TaxID=2025313 RepID=A0A5R8WPB5_9BACT|nr:T9SS type A sorting domain-containing protein [Hymenobacter jeollabukensis]TLM91895.1 T9SS type A sorting domain-containing protein [Hymenobacter jeollabukensis]